MARDDFNFCFPFRVRYSEVDQQGVVFNAHYLTWFDSAITEYFRALAYDYMSEVAQRGEDFHTVRNLVEYHAPIAFDEEIEVHVRVGRIGRSSLTFALEIHPLGREELRATGEVVWVNTNQSTHRSAPLPEELVARINAHADAQS